LLAEPKQVPHNYADLMRGRRGHGHGQRDLPITGGNGSTFKLFTRQSQQNPLNFSAILAYELPRTTAWFRLCRYNGTHGQHTNRIEGDVIRGFHIHLATARYQDLGMREDSYAVATDNYATLREAMECLFVDCAVSVAVAPGGSQTKF